MSAFKSSYVAFFNSIECVNFFFMKKFHVNETSTQSNTPIFPTLFIIHNYQFSVKMFLPWKIEMNRFIWLFTIPLIIIFCDEISIPVMSYY